MSSTEPTMPLTGPVVDADAPLAPATQSIRIRLRTPSPLRNLEFWLVLIAIAITGAAVTLVQLGALGALLKRDLVFGKGKYVIPLRKRNRYWLATSLYLADSSTPEDPLPLTTN